MSAPLDALESKPDALTCPMFEAHGEMRIMQTHTSDHKLYRAMLECDKCHARRFVRMSVPEEGK